MEELNYKLNNMMNFTEGTFEFPVRIYDGFSIRQAMKKEETLEVPQDGDWAQGIVGIPLNEYHGYYEYFEPGRDLSTIDEEGFDGVIVMTKSLGDFMCTWPLEKFKKELNKFANEYTDKVENLVNEELAKKAEFNVVGLLAKEEKKKRSWWKGKG
jgi:hypothetical protein